MPRLLNNVAATRRLPREVKPGLPPGKTGGLGGQPPFVPTDEQRTKVRRLVACGFTQESIAVVTGIPEATLQRHFAFQLQHGKVISDANILTGIITQAEEGDKTMSIFWAKARAGWRDVGKDGDQGAGATAFVINISNNSNPPTIDGERITVIHSLPEPEEEP